MAQAKLTDQEFRQAWIACGGQAAVLMRECGYTNVRGIYERRNALEKRYGWHLPSGGIHNGYNRGDAGATANDYLQRVTIDGFTGTAVVFSDCHYWPTQEPTIAHRALVEVVREIRPNLVIGNGDLFDGAKLSRFPRNGWEYQPRVADELEAAKA